MVHKQQKMRSLWTLHPEVTFLNHGSFGGCPIPVLQTQSKYRDELESEPVSFFLERYPVYLEQTRNALGSFLHVEPERLVMVRNATEGVNAILGSVDFRDRDEVLVTSLNYPAVEKPFSHFKESLISLLFTCRFRRPCPTKKSYSP